jgi:pimeloyl-ACP methyl ester carboxylesterase
VTAAGGGDARARIRKRYVDVAHGQVHLRVGGRGPAVVLLHDSPRSSVMHLPNIGWLGEQFTVYALDTPGYGNSTPLPAEPAPAIADFAAALEATLHALGLDRPAVYGFHTSSKIALELATRPQAPLGGAVLDGLSLPAAPPPEAFIASYMLPFSVAEDGSHLVTQWSKILDFHRYFPWFRREAASRLDMALPDDAALHAYALDTLMAGASWSSAYAAAMRYPARDSLASVRHPLTFTCRSDDVLFGFLAALPEPLPAGARRVPLGPAPEEWRANLAAWLAEYAAPGEPPRPPDPLDARSAAQRRGYVDVADSQVHLRLAGEGPRVPLLMLHDLPGSAAALERLGALLAQDRTVLMPDLPGCGESDALETPTAAAYVEALLGCLDRLRMEVVDVFAEHLASPLALELAERAPRRVRRLVFDGLAPTAAQERTALAERYCPRLQPRRDGANWLSGWHFLGDRECSWPWFDRSRAAVRRRTPTLDAPTRHAVLVDLLKQPGRCGDGLAAALSVPLEARLSATQAPLTVLYEPSDVRDARVPAALAGRPDSRILAVAPRRTWEVAEALRRSLDG